MVRFLVMYPQPADVAAFEKHYNDVHLPLARKLSELRSYKVGREARSVRGEGSLYLVAELEWDDMASLQRDFASTTGQAAARDMDYLEALCPGVRSAVYELSSV